MLRVKFAIMKIHDLIINTMQGRNLNYEHTNLTMSSQIHPMPRPYRRAWWRHLMETISALLAICVGNGTGEFPTQRPVTRSFDAFFDLRLNKLLSKQSWGWWFETLSHPLWRHRNGYLGKKILRDIEQAMYLEFGIIILKCIVPWVILFSCRRRNRRKSPGFW